ncbi:MAG: lipoyl(octanoyl) transferase LipB [Actinobacteria bacterium]|nr:lipoyl(octanoyl) transferase LipB [Actinomycetota bacterium]
MKPIWDARLGQVPYERARALQKRLEAARLADEIPDVLLLLEHPPTYTKGRRAEPGGLGMGEDWYRMQGIEVTEADRGGGVTYHGPGQLIGYPIVSLRHLSTDGVGSHRGIGVASYVRGLERLMIETLGSHGVSAGVVEGLTGVWAGPPELLLEGIGAAEVASGELRKIGSIGVHVNRGVTTHGFAVNVNNDLQPFEWIVPCGIEGCRMTSICRELGGEQDMGALMDEVSRRFAGIYGLRPQPVEPAALSGSAEQPLPSAASAPA